MPKGTIAPGNVLPPPLVQVRVSTSAAGLLIGAVTVAVLRAPAGRFAFGTGFGQSTRCPSEPFAQTTGFVGVAAVPAADRCGAGLGVAGPLGLGLGDGEDGAAVAAAVPPIRTATARTVTVPRRRGRRCEPKAVIASSKMGRSSPNRGPV